MVINRFFFEGTFDAAPSLKGDEHEHLAKVVRAAAGEEIELVDGRGHLATARIQAILRHETQLTLLAKSHQSPPPHPFTLVQGICRQNRLDLLLEKGTELGIDHFIFVPMDRSEKRPLSPERLERMRRITVSALKQCGRLYLPTISLLPSLSALKQLSFFFGDIDPSAKPLLELLPSPHRTFIVGPESGFSDKEHQWLKEHGTGVKLHPNILRCETAGMAAATIFGQFSYDRP
jgi:16S rRNA (uracil1498-N3)-methyltransferase